MKSQTDRLITVDAETMRTLASLSDERIMEIIQIARSMPEDAGIAWRDVVIPSG